MHTLTRNNQAVMHESKLLPLHHRYQDASNQQCFNSLSDLNNIVDMCSSQLKQVNGTPLAETYILAKQGTLVLLKEKTRVVKPFKKYKQYYVNLKTVDIDGKKRSKAFKLSDVLNSIATQGGNTECQQFTFGF